MTAGGTRLAALAAAALLAGCASIGGPRPGNAADGDVLAGRMSVKVAASADAAARAVSAGFELAGSAESGRLDLTTPLGTLVAHTRWSPAGVVLATPAEGETAYPDLAALTRRLLGEELPVAALFDWLRGRPWPGAPSAPLAAADGPGFAQLGWRVSLARRDEGVIGAVRDESPAVTVQVRLDRPESAADAAVR